MMLSPVRCACGAVYDLATVEVTARHADCSVWKSPCCGIVTDDNIWSTHHRFTKISRAEAEEPFVFFPDGRMVPNRVVRSA